MWDVLETWIFGICCQIGASAGAAFILCGMSFLWETSSAKSQGQDCEFLCSYPHPSCMFLLCSFVDTQLLCSGITGSHQLVCKPCPSFFQGISETCSSGSNRICWKSDQSYLYKGNLCEYNCYESSLCFSVDPHSLGNFSCEADFLLSKSMTMKTQDLLKW